MFRWRKMTWVLVAWIALTVLFIVAINAVDTKESLDDCIAESGGGSAAEAGCEIGTEIAPAVWTTVGIVVGFMGFVVLSIIWLMTRPRRHCPACGRDAKKGTTVCRKCGYDFAIAARPNAQPQSFAPPPPPASPPEVHGRR